MPQRPSISPSSIDAVTGSAARGAAAIARLVRARIGSQLYDESGSRAGGTAIYTLSDPRDLRVARYVGQTRAPRVRYLQHVRDARLWLADDLPWWVTVGRQRPLYEWIRSLFADGQRLPVMIVTAWHEAALDATLAERALIREHVVAGAPLLNVDHAAPDPQLELL